MSTCAHTQASRAQGRLSRRPRDLSAGCRGAETPTGHTQDLAPKGRHPQSARLGSAAPWPRVLLCLAGAQAEGLTNVLSAIASGPWIEKDPALHFCCHWAASASCRSHQQALTKRTPAVNSAWTGGPSIPHFTRACKGYDTVQRDTQIHGGHHAKKMKAEALDSPYLLNRSL